MLGAKIENEVIENEVSDFEEQLQRSSTMIKAATSDQIGPSNNDEKVFAYDLSDDSLEQAADPERLCAVTLAFCSGLQTCPA